MVNEPVTTPLTRRQLVLVVLLAAFGSVVLLELTLRVIIIPFQVRSQLTVGLIGLLVLYLANLPFGFLVGHSWPRRRLIAYAYLGVAVGLAQWLADTAWFVAYGLSASFFSWLIIYGVAPALIFSSAAVIGDRVRKGQLTLDVALISSVIGLLSAIIGLILRF
jgi:hypothetical protein